MKTLILLLSGSYDNNDKGISRELSTYYVQGTLMNISHPLSYFNPHKQYYEVGVLQIRKLRLEEVINLPQCHR